MNQTDRFKKLVKVANSKGVNSPEFKRAFDEFKSGFGSDSSRKPRPRGVPTNGTSTKRNRKDSYPTRPSNDDDA